MSDDKYIAFDVHRATTVVSVLNAVGREVNATILPTQAQPLLGFLQGLRGRLHLTLEEGTYSAWLYDLLEGRVRELVVCDPRHNALLKEGKKTDAGDARKLAKLLRAGMLRAVYHGGRSLRSLHELACSYEAQVQDTTRVMSRIKAFLPQPRHRLRGAGRVYAPATGELAARGIAPRPTAPSTEPAKEGAASAAGGEPQADGGGTSAGDPRAGASACSLADRWRADAAPLPQPAQFLDLRVSGTGPSWQRRVRPGRRARRPMRPGGEPARPESPPPARAETALQVGGADRYPLPRTLLARRTGSRQTEPQEKGLRREDANGSNSF